MRIAILADMPVKVPANFADYYRKMCEYECVRQIVFDCTVTEMNGKLLDLTTSEYLILLQMRNRQLAGEPALTREELLERVTFEERTLDAALANLKRRGFITRRVELHLSEEGLSVAAI